MRILNVVLLTLMLMCGRSSTAMAGETVIAAMAVTSPVIEQGGSTYEVPYGPGYVTVATPSDAIPAEENVVDEVVEDVEIEETVPIGNRWGITLTPEELDTLAKIVDLEAGNQSDLGQQAVVEVVF